MKNEILIKFLCKILIINIISVFFVCSDCQANTNTDSLFLKLKDKLIKRATEYLSSNVDSAILYSNRLIILSSKEKSNDGLIEGNILYAKSLVLIGNYSAAAKYANNAYILSKSIKNYELIAKTLRLQGEINRASRKFVNAVLQVKDALAIYKQLNDTTNMGVCYNRLSAILYETLNYKQAQIYADSSILCFNKVKNDLWCANTFNILGAIYSELKEFGKAISYLQDALKFYEKHNQILDIPNILNNIANLHLKKGDYKQAILYASKSKTNAYQNKVLAYTRVSCIILSNSYLALKDYKNAYCYADSFNKVSMLIYEKNTYIDSLNTNYMSEREELVKAKIMDDSKRKLYEKNKLLVLTLGFLIFFILLLIFLFFQYRERNRVYQILVKQNREQVKIEDELYLKEQQLKQLLPPLPVEEQLENEANNPNDLDVLDEVYDEFKEISKNRLQVVRNKLDAIIYEKKVYINPDITITSLATELKTNRTDLSKCINEFYDQNFNTFINSLRVKETQRLLSNADYDNFSIEGIAEMAGFSNKSTFYKAFKLQTGVTPNFYKEHLIE